MKLVEIIRALVSIPKTRKHIVLIQNQLIEKTYESIINDNVLINSKGLSLQAIVKNYFWACRTIKKCQCLPRSIALYHALKSNGFTVKHCFGVNKTNVKLAAHAWVELNGVALNEAKDLRDKFNVLKLVDQEIIDLNHDS